MSKAKIFLYVVMVISVAVLLIKSGAAERKVWATESAQAPQVTDLNNLDQLKEAYQRDRGTVRLVALLSPICPACRSGFADMQSVMKAIPDDRLRVYIVWLPMFPGDSRKWAQTRSEEFSDKRLQYFWDGEKISGKAWQRPLNTPREAWDVYLLYGADSQWDKEPATPDFWMHQLSSLTHAPKLETETFRFKTKELLGKVKR